MNGIKTIFLKTCIALAITLSSSIGSTFANDKSATMTVFKTPTCGCCQKWIDHLDENGLATKSINLNNLSGLKDKYAISGKYRSCHTGVVVTEQADYIFEGHVPAEFVEKFLDNPPADALGLSVPGMPIGSPGMEVGDRKDYYQVLLLKKDGSSEIYAHVNRPG